MLQFCCVMIDVIVPVTFHCPPFDVAIAKEDILATPYAALLTAHVCVTAVRLLYRACPLPWAIVPATFLLFFPHVALMDHPGQCSFPLLLPKSIICLNKHYCRKQVLMASKDSRFDQHLSIDRLPCKHWASWHKKNKQQWSMLLNFSSAGSLYFGVHPFVQRDCTM